MPQSGPTWALPISSRTTWPRRSRPTRRPWPSTTGMPQPGEAWASPISGRTNWPRRSWRSIRRAAGRILPAARKRLDGDVVLGQGLGTQEARLVGLHLPLAQADAFGVVAVQPLHA